MAVQERNRSLYNLGRTRSSRVRAAPAASGTASVSGGGSLVGTSTSAGGSTHFPMRTRGLIGHHDVRGGANALRGSQVDAGLSGTAVVSGGGSITATGLQDEVPAGGRVRGGARVRATVNSAPGGGAGGGSTVTGNGSITASGTKSVSGTALLSAAGNQDALGQSGRIEAAIGAAAISGGGLISAASDPSHGFWFMPPNEPSERVPRWDRIPGAPRSFRYRAFMRYTVGKDITINGVLYQGGRWSGPLSEAERAAIIDAGYADRIFEANEDALGTLPASVA